MRVVLTLLGKPGVDKEVPSGNLIVMLLVTIFFALQMTLDSRAQYLNGLVLGRWSALAMFSYMWLHMNYQHIVGNLVTLWLFGRRVSVCVGNAMYVLMYVCAGLGSAIVHVLYDGRPVIGASGAIMGVFGMYVVLYFTHFGRMGPWFILLWFLATLWASIFGGFQISYVAHIGGFLSGVSIAILLVRLRVADHRYVDPQLVRVLRVGDTVTKSSA